VKKLKKTKKKHDTDLKG